jgi:hypothetical protein
VRPSDGDLRAALGVLGPDLERWRAARERRRLAPTVLADCRRIQEFLTRFLARHRRSGLAGAIPD